MKGTIIFILLGLALLPSKGGAATASYALDGNAFSSASGQYAAVNHCEGQTCDWISGHQMILGAFDSNPDSWTGGSATWSFSIDVPLDHITAASVTLEWPNSYGKGLHSLTDDSKAVVKVGSERIAAPAVSANYRCPQDYFAFPCAVYSKTFSIPPSLVQAKTKLSVSVPEKTLWDIGKVTLKITYGEPDRIEIKDGKFYVNKRRFLIKGVAYAPWIPGTGPDRTVGHKPFPSRPTTNVTAQLTKNGKIYVKDYSGDGKIQASEVLRFDLEKMKTLGINTVRLYACAPWHDKNLNGKIDRSSGPDRDEIVQGDLPDWAVKYILDEARKRGMMVIVGYWVQEEDFKQDPPVCNWEDLKVAKQALGRMVRKYRDHPALLAWGVGNEVNNEKNHTWFEWDVQPNEYLNALFAHVRSLDTAHPVMYARYFGEPAGFNELDADVIAVNAFTHPASKLGGEFDPPAESGQAYMLGEFGHIRSQAADQWSLAKKYAGGCFLEFNDVWWKGDGQDQLGVLDEYRKKKERRFKTLRALYD